MDVPEDPPAFRERRHYPRVLRLAEAKLVHARRTAASGAVSSTGNPRDAASKDMPDDTFGVALSGGGIRSATFCLGVFRALARLRLVREIDFLSTVSGGGYFGSFLGGLYTPRGNGPADAPRRSAGASRRVEGSGGQPAGTQSDCVESNLKRLDSPQVEWLRDNGRYLSPNGAGDTLMAGAVLLRNWIALTVVVSTLAVFVFATAAVIQDWSWLSDKVGLPGVAVGVNAALNQNGLSPNPVYALPALLAILCVVPLACAYWLTPFAKPLGRGERLTRLRGLWILFAGLALVGAVAWRLTGPNAWMGTVLPPEVLLAAFWWFFACHVAFPKLKATVSDTNTKQAVHPVALLMRNHLSRWLSISLWASAGLALFAVTDRLGWMLAERAVEAAKTGPGGVAAVLASTGTALLAAFGIVQKLVPLLDQLGTGKRLAVRPQFVVVLAALVAGASVLIALSTLAHWLMQGGKGAVWVGSGALTLVFGAMGPFLNLSSHSTLYAQRLTRAYLGASNRTRHKGTTRISETLPEDGIALADYEPFANGGPLHLINVTLNETVSGTSQLEQRDRKGRPLALGPEGMTVGRWDHALWSEGQRGRKLEAIASTDCMCRRRVFPSDNNPFDVEELGLGEWTSISGAAVTTGIGSRTSLALTLLLGLANVRLGYWWDSRAGGAGAIAGRAAGWKERLFTALSRVHPVVYVYLLKELLARFPGPAARLWYLSDGGHFENTGAYELIRRRLRNILICDAGCDPEYKFQDLANLVRKVRMDFDAEIVFYSGAQLDELLPGAIRPYFGTQADFQRLHEPAERPPETPKHVAPHALLAAVFYRDPERRKKRPDSVLVILKPMVAGDEPSDVVEYWRAHKRFPHESTADQFFDEAQWESYRRLGEHMASRIFEYPTAVQRSGRWRPAVLARPLMSTWPGTPEE